MLRPQSHSKHQLSLTAKLRIPSHVKGGGLDALRHRAASLFSMKKAPGGSTLTITFNENELANDNTNRATAFGEYIHMAVCSIFMILAAHMIKAKALPEQDILIY